MADPLSTAGYEDLRSYVQNNWKYVALINDSGTEVTRINIPNDSRASWTSGSGSNPLEVEVVVTGGDSDIDVQSNGATTISKAASYKTSTGGSNLGDETLTNATLEASQDELTVTHTIEIPPQ